MARIDPSLIKSFIMRDERLFVPRRITDAIGGCLVSPVDAIREESEKLKRAYKAAEDKAVPFSYDYGSDATIDAYSVSYLPRNTLIPKMAILCCSYHPELQELPPRLRVLDLGSGMGGVVLGLLDLLDSMSFLGTHLDIMAVDSSRPGLVRQQQLVQSLGVPVSSYRRRLLDLSAPTAYQWALAQQAPYDLVFVANLFREMEPGPTEELLAHVAPLLSDGGVLVDVEAQSNYTMTQRIRVAKTASELGLNMYYPCPPGTNCLKAQCWNWRTDEFHCEDVPANGATLQPTSVQTANWMILCKKPISIYDVLRKEDPSLVWGVSIPYPPKVNGDVVKQGYEFCTEQGRMQGTTTHAASAWHLSRDVSIKRGLIVGIAPTLNKFMRGWDMLTGFVE